MTKLSACLYCLRFSCARFSHGGNLFAISVVRHLRRALMPSRAFTDDSVHDMLWLTL
jgi:hypothetical protein